MNRIKTTIVEQVHDSLKPDDPIIQNATKYYMLYFTEKEELLKVKGFDREGRVTYNKGFSILSTMNMESDVEVFLYSKVEPLKENVVHILLLDEENNNLVLETYHRKRLMEKWVRKYDEKGQVIEDVHTFVPYDAEIRMEYKVNDKGQITKSILYDLDMKEERITEFKYKGELLKETVVYLRGISGLYPSLKKEYLHSKEDRLTEERELLYPDVLLKSINYYYDGENLSKREEVTHLGIPGENVAVFHYDKKGNLVREEGYKKDIISYSKEFYYDDKERLVEQVVKDSEGIRIAEVKYQYNESECKMPDRLLDFFKDRFYLDLKSGAIRQESGLSKSSDGEFKYSLFYDYDDKGYLVGIRKREG